MNKALPCTFSKMFTLESIALTSSRPLPSILLFVFMTLDLTILFSIFLISLFNKNSSSSLDVSKLETIFFLASKSESFLFLFSLISYKGASSFVANDVSSFKKVNSFFDGKSHDSFAHFSASSIILWITG